MFCRNTNNRLNYDQMQSIFMNDWNATFLMAEELTVVGVDGERLNVNKHHEHFCLLNQVIFPNLNQVLWTFYDLSNFCRCEQLYGMVTLNPYENASCTLSGILFSKTWSVLLYVRGIIKHKQQAELCSTLSNGSETAHFPHPRPSSFWRLFGFWKWLLCQTDQSDKAATAAAEGSWVGVRGCIPSSLIRSTLHTVAL